MFINYILLKGILKPVWKCSYGCFSKCFLCWNALKWCFFILKKSFLRLAHQNDSKYTKKKLIFNKTKLNFGGTRIAPRSNRSLYYENEIITIKDSNMHRDNNLRNHYIKMNNFWLWIFITEIISTWPTVIQTINSFFVWIKFNGQGKIKLSTFYVLNFE
jgi:hypothetical protein